MLAVSNLDLDLIHSEDPRTGRKESPASQFSNSRSFALGRAGVDSDRSALATYLARILVKGSTLTSWLKGIRSTCTCRNTLEAPLCELNRTCGNLDIGGPCLDLSFRVSCESVLIAQVLLAVFWNPSRSDSHYHLESPLSLYLHNTNISVVIIIATT
jgi:hypothetical protein